MNLTKYSKLNIANNFLNNLTDPKVILLKPLTTDIKRNMWKFSEYVLEDYEYSEYDDLDYGLNIHSLELEVQDGYNGPTPIDDIYIVEDDNKICIKANEVILYNNPLIPNDFKINGFAVTNEDKVISYEIFRSTVHILEDDLIIRWTSEMIGDETIQSLFTIGEIQ